MKTFILILLSLTCGFGQVKMEEHEFTGTVISINSGYGFALGGIDIQVGNDPWRFWVASKYGKSVLSKIKVGETISLKAQVRATEFNDKKLRDLIFKSTSIYHGMAHEVKLGNEWIPTPSDQMERFQSTTGEYVFLEQKVLDDYHLDGLRKGLIFKNGMVSFAIYATLDKFSMEEFLPGDVVSFVGHRSPVKDGYVYPIDGVKDVYSFNPLTKIEGPITSFLYQENFARVGLVVKQKRLSFPSEYAKKIDPFANGEKVSVYFTNPSEWTHELPSIKAIVQGQDTLFIPYKFNYPDKHEHNQIEFEGKISKITRSVTNGRIINIIVGTDYFVEVNLQMAEQVGQLLFKGKQVKINGEERTKMEGEIYQKDYQLIIPKKIGVDGKEFILN